jgi:hypothetical protein
MPAEVGRLQHKLGGRDKSLLGLVGCAAVLAVPLGLVLSHGGSAAQPQPGCVSADVAGLMGGGTVKGCGAAAKALCRLYASSYPGIARQCARLPAGTNPATVAD